MHTHTAEILENNHVTTYTKEQLSGIGIVCGFDVFMDNYCTIKISEGIGVTSIGKVLNGKSKQFKYYCSFEDECNYFEEILGIACPIFELLEEGGSGGIPLLRNIHTKEDFDDFIRDKVVVVYQNESDDCIKYLLIHKQYLQDLIAGQHDTHQSSPVLKENKKNYSEPANKERNVSLFDFDETSTESDKEEPIFLGPSLDPIILPRFGYCLPKDAEENSKELQDKFVLSVDADSNNVYN